MARVIKIDNVEEFTTIHECGAEIGYYRSDIKHINNYGSSFSYVECPYCKKNIILK